METFSFDVTVSRSEANFDRACEEALRKAMSDELEATGQGHHRLHSIQVKFEKYCVSKESWRESVEHVYDFRVSGVWLV